MTFAQFSVKILPIFPNNPFSYRLFFVNRPFKTQAGNSGYNVTGDNRKIYFLFLFYFYFFSRDDTGNWLGNDFRKDGKGRRRVEGQEGS